MARSFTNAKVFSAFIADQISVIATRRGYAAAASQGAVASGGVRGGVRGKMNLMMKKGGGAGEDTTKTTTSWVPDPVTGYYRPESHANEIDAAELRNLLLNHKHKLLKSN